MIVSEVHNEVTKELIDLESFVTLCYTRYDQKKMVVKIVDCGHMATIHWRRHPDSTTFVRGENFPLGFTEYEEYKQIEEPYQPGDLFFYYSDGVTEAQSRFGEMFGAERLSELIRRSGRIEPQKLVERVKAAVVAFTRSEKFADDLTCVAVKIDEMPLTAPIDRREIDVPNHLGQLEHIRKFVTETLSVSPEKILDEEEVYQLMLAVTEAASNVIRHALGDNPNAMISVSTDLFPDRIIVRLSHFGKDFDPDTAPPPVFDGTREGGFGVYMIRQCVDDVQYQHNPDGKNTIRMVKRSSKR
jgi:sigma-B regulation protein RsbU (phosphoserine phosphatase)